MVKVRLQGTTCEIKRMKRCIERNKRIKVISVSDAFPNKGTKERLRVLYEFFNQDKMEPFHFSFKEMAESGNTVKDYIAPQGFEFRFPGRYKMGHMFGATKYLDIISPKLNDELLKRLLDIDSNISISIHMRTIEPTEASVSMQSTRQEKMLRK